MSFFDTNIVAMPLEASVSIPAPPIPPAEPSAGQVEIIRAYRRIPFKTQILLTANIHKKFIEKLILSASLIHRFKETLIIKVAAVKLFEEKLCLIGGLNVMDWIYDKFEEFIADDEDERLTE